MYIYLYVYIFKTLFIKAPFNKEYHVKLTLV